METTNNILLLQMKRIYISIDRMMNELTEQSGLTAAQTSVLTYLLEHSKSRMMYATNIHKEFGLSRATVSGLVKKLKTKGYLTIQDCEGDDRQKRIVVTDKAREVQQMLAVYIQTVGNCVYKDLSNGEKIMLEEMQRKMIQNLKTGYHTNKKENKEEQKH